MKSLVMGGLLVALLAGCQTPPPPLRPPMPPPTTDAGQPMVPLTDKNAPTSAQLSANQKEAPPGQSILLVRLNLITVLLPVGAVSDSAEVWSYVNEEPASGRPGSSLGFNGLRVGLGKEAAWADLSKILNKLTGQPMMRSQMVVRPGSPTPIVLKAKQDEQIVFLYRGDRTLSGKDLPPGDNLLMLAAGVNYDDPSSALLSCCPVLRTTRYREKYIRTPNGWSWVTEPDYFPMDTLEFQLKVPPGGFVVIGPNREAHRTTSAGYRFLMLPRKGLLYETMWIIAPEIYMAPLVKQP
jgi:hypothetical protein